MPSKTKKIEPHSKKPISESAQSFLRHLMADHRISAGKRIGVAVSGGADSVALLRLLIELRKELGIVLSVVHFNHKLRGKASDADEKFVAKLAGQYRLPFFVDRENVGAKAKQQRANLEDTARRSRYAFFDRLAAEGQLDRVAVAHTADDQAETVLSHILRGTGIAGLGGIHPETGIVFRPLLKVRRADLRSYLRSLNQRWREDATNRDTTRTRARIRHKLLPFLEKQFQGAVVEHLGQLSELAREDDAWLETSAELHLQCAAKQEEGGGWRLPIIELRLDAAHDTAGTLGRAQGIMRRADRTAPDGPMSPASEALGKRMIRLLVKRAKPHSGQLGVVHVEAVLRLAQDPDSGKSLHLPGGVEIRRERDSLLFRPLQKRGQTVAREPFQSFAQPIDLTDGQAELRLVEHSQVLRFRVIDWPAEGRETSKTGAVLDRDKLVEPLVVRNWQPGDSLRPLGHQKHHTLSRLLNELGVSRWAKASWPVLTCGGKIAWCRGLPAATEFAAGAATRKGVAIVEVPIS
jgi:tRNA(Ile)-lysidine synthase